MLLYGRCRVISFWKGSSIFIRGYSDAVQTDVRTRILADIKGAMKAKDSVKSTTLRSVLTDVYAADKQKAQPIPNSKIQDIIRKAVDRRKDVASQYENASRSDLAEKERKEAAILSEFLPPQLSEEEIDRVLREVIQEQGLLKPDAKPNPKQALDRIFKAFYTRVDKSAVSSTEYVTRRAEAILTDASRSN